MALVTWIRLLPQALPDIDDHAGAGAQQRSADLTYTGTDGREHVYLGDFDSHLWLRYARNLLRSGSPCEALVDGECRDTQTNAPVGASTPYARTLHVSAIAGLHRVIASFDPAYPLPASAFLVPVVVGALGVLPAFFITRALAGTAAAVFAGVLTAVHPIVLTRTTGGDNDVWQVVLPLYLVWAAMAAVAAATIQRALSWSAVAGLVIALQAWAWRGWPFIYIVVIAGLAATAVVAALGFSRRERTLRLWRAPGLQRVALVLVVLYVVAGIGATLAHSEEPYFALPGRAADALLRAVTGAADPAAASEWPNVLSDVAELTPLRLRDIASANGGGPVFVASLIGLLLLVLPRTHWQWWHRGALAAGAVVFAWTVMATDSSRVTALTLLGLPLVGVVLARSWFDDDAPLRDQAAAFVVIVWFLAAVAIAHEGRRLLLVLAPPFGIACAVLIGRSEAWLRRQIHGLTGTARVAGAALLTGVVALAIAHPARWGVEAARRYSPIMHDGWWDALTTLRETAAPDAIVHTWWDYGHWAAFLTERRVSNDGASLRTHVPNWMSRALVSSSDTASAGILRMLTCGSDATPLPEGSAGAYGRLRALGQSPAAAYAILSDLIVLSDAEAAALLTARGFTDAQRDDILSASHCRPPDSYLVLNSGLVAKRDTWMALGQWQPRDDATPATNTVAASADLPFVASWLPCDAAEPGGEMRCAVGLALDGSRPVLEAFSFRLSSLELAQLHARRRGADAASTTPMTGTPALVLVAEAGGLREIAFPTPTYPGVAVLLDAAGQRILVGSETLLKSTFVQLMYLDGRYTTRFVKQDEHEAMGERIVTWRVR